jgi:serine/threonine protein kinase
MRAFQLGELPDRVAAAVAAHVERCAACASLAERLDGTADLCVALLRGAASPATPGDRDRSTSATTDDAGPAPTAGAGPQEFPRPFGAYELLGELGRGGMGVVFLARQRRPARIVALKLILAGAHASAERRARFLAEADATGRLQHPNIVQIYEAGEHDGQLFLALEYVDGGNLAGLLAGRPCDPVASAALVEKLARAVHYAHETGIVHRDLKPANILLVAGGGWRVEGEGRRVEGGGRTTERSPPTTHHSPPPTHHPPPATLHPKIADFGLAKQDEGQLTSSSAMLGTPAYMAPEQASGDNRRVGPAADIYALGAILYEMLTGRPPFQAANALDLLEQVRSREPAPPRRPDGRIPPDLGTICLKCLHKEPSRRYANALELAEDLGRFQAGEPIRARPVRAPERLWRWVSRNPAWAGVLAAVAVLLVAGTAISTWQAVRATDAEAEAREAERLARLDRDKARSAEAEATRERDKAVRAEVQAKQERDNAVTARNRADAEKARADDEAALARAVSNFLRRDLLQLASPVVYATLERHPDKDVKLRTILDRASRVIVGRFPGRPLVEAAIRESIGRAYLELGEYALAQQHLEATLATRLVQQGPDNPETLTAQNNLAEAYRALGQLARAEALHTRTFEARLRVFGPEHLDTLQSQHNLATLCFNLGQYARAEPLLVQCLEVFRRVLGPEDLRTLIALNNLGNLHQARGKYDLAEPLYLEQLEIARRKLGDEHPHTLLTQNNLAALYQAQGFYDKAETLYLQTLAAQRRTLGDDHPDTLLTTHNLGGVYRARGLFAQAEKLLLATLEAQRRKTGPNHPHTLRFQYHLAGLYADQDLRDQAEALYRETLEAQRKVLAADHPDVLDTEVKLATLYRKNNQDALAEPLLVRILETRRKTLGAEHPDTLSTQGSLALLYKSLRQYDKAEALYLKTLASYRAALGLEHPDALLTQNNLGSLYLMQHRFAEAEPLCLSVYDLRRKNLGEENPSTLSSLNNVAVLVEGQGRFAEAEALHRKALEAYHKLLGDDHKETLTSQLNLAAVCLVEGKCAEAEKLLMAMLEPCRKHLGATHTLTQNVEIRLKLLPQLRAFGEAYQKALAARGPEHADTLAAQTRWAAVLGNNKIRPQAEQHVLAVLAVRERLLGPDHGDTLTARQLHAWLLLQAGKRDDALELERRVVAAVLRVKGERDRFTVEILGEAVQIYRHLKRQDAEFAELLMVLGRHKVANKEYAAAEALLRECLTIRGKYLPDDWQTLETRSLLGAALAGQQKYNAAEPLLLASYEGLQRLAAEIPRRWRWIRVHEAAARLVQLYEATGEEEKAAAWRERLRG